MDCLCSIIKWMLQVGLSGAVTAVILYFLIDKKQYNREINRNIKQFLSKHYNDWVKFQFCSIANLFYIKDNLTFFNSTLYNDYNLLEEDERKELSNRNIIEITNINLDEDKEKLKNIIKELPIICDYEFILKDLFYKVDNLYSIRFKDELIKCDEKILIDVPTDKFIYLEYLKKNEKDLLQDYINNSDNYKNTLHTLYNLCYYISHSFQLKLNYYPDLGEGKDIGLTKEDFYLSLFIFIHNIESNYFNNKERF